jgi:5-methylcytosine-specific restriction endonuclease McrA
MDLSSIDLRPHLLNPIPEIFEAARLLDEAVTAHVAGDRAKADQLIRAADLPEITAWTESLWGPGGPWTRPLPVANPLPSLPRELRIQQRMPGVKTLAGLLERDGYHCRFCGIPVIRAEVRKRMRAAYPDALRWGTRNSDQHAAFQALWLTYDHLVPHARGGTNDPENLVVACQPCNCGRSNLTLEEAGLSDPREREPGRSSWDGLERFCISPRPTT